MNDLTHQERYAAKVAEAIAAVDTTSLYLDGLYVQSFVVAESGEAVARYRWYDVAYVRTPTITEDERGAEVEGWTCDECGMVITGPDGQSVDHAGWCSLHPANEVTA